MGIATKTEELATTCSKNEKVGIASKQSQKEQFGNQADQRESKDEAEGPNDDGDVKEVETSKVRVGVAVPEGFNEDDIMEFMEIFHEFDRDGGGSIDRNELNAMMRFLGYPVGPRTIFDIMQEFDTDGSGDLDVDEFTQFMLQIEASQRAKMVDLFSKFCVGTVDEEYLTPEGLVGVVQAMGFEVKPEAVLEVFKEFDFDGNGKVDLQEFFEFTKQYREFDKQRTREHAGFTIHEVAEFTEVFHEMDENNDGSLQFSEWFRLLEELGREPRTIEQQKKLVQRMTESDKDGNGTLSIKEFLFLLRRHLDEDEILQYEKEQDAARKLNFTEAEVVELREIFEKERGESSDGEFAMFGLRAVLRALGVAKMSNTEANELRVLFRSFAAPSEANEKGLQLYFCDFLLLMGKLYQEDFAGIRQCVVSVVETRDNERKRIEALVSQVKEEASLTPERNSSKQSKNSSKGRNSSRTSKNRGT